MRSGNIAIWTATVVGLLGASLLLSGCGQKVAAPLPFQAIVGATGTTPTTRVSLYGTVRDQNGVPVAGAQVSLGTKRTTSAADGLYRFTGLAPGTYQVSASLGGYIAGGAAFIVATTDRGGADITITALEFIPDAEDVRGTETVEVSEEGVTVGVKTIFSGEAPIGVPPEQVALAGRLVLESGVQIKDAVGNVVTEAPDIGVTYLQQSQLPVPATGTFGMKAADVVKRPGAKQTATTDITIEGARTQLTVESPNEMLRKGSTVQARNTPFAGFALEANGQQGWTFDKPQVFTIDPANLTPPVDLSALPAGTRIPFADPDGKIVYGTVQVRERGDGTEFRVIELRVSKLTTYVMRADFGIEVTDSEVEASVKAGAAKSAAPQLEITGSTTFTFEPGIDPATQAFLTYLIAANLDLAVGVQTFEVPVLPGQEVVTVITVSELVIDIVIGGIVVESYTVTLIAENDIVQYVLVEERTHESGGGA